MDPVSNSTSILLTSLAGTRVGFSALAVREIVRSVAIAPFPGAPAIIEGAVNLHGRIVPVVNVRHRLDLPALPNSPDQFLVVLETSDRYIAIRVDDIDEVVDIETPAADQRGELSPVLRHLAGVAATSDGALVIYDAAAFVTQAEREAMDVAAKDAAMDVAENVTG